MWRHLASLSSRLTTATSTSSTVFRISARSLKLTAQRFSKKTPSELKFKVGGVQKLNSNESSQFKQWLDWLPTEEGQQKMAIYVGTGGTAFITFCSWWYNIFSLEMFIHEYCLARDKPLLRIVSTESSQLQPSPELRRLGAMCQTRAGVGVDDIDRLIIFDTELMDPVSNGCLASSQGAAVGLPQHFTRGPGDLKSLLVKTGYNRWFKGFRLPSDLSAEDEAELRDCLTLTREETEFAVSLSMARVNSWYSVFSMILPPGLWLSGYSLGHTINRRLNLFTKPRHYRLMTHSWLAISVLAGYFLYLNASSWESDSDCSRVICSSKAETEAGVSYYQKILRRNVLLRRLLGQEMEYYIQESGEYVPLFYEIEYFRNISTKIQNLQDLGEELASQENAVLNINNDSSKSDTT